LKNNPDRYVLGFIKFFGTPLCIAAMLAALVAFTRAREGRWEAAVLAALIALACGAAGFGAIWWIRFHARADTSEQLRDSNPRQPWLWREDWAAGEVRTTSRRDEKRLTLFALAWCLVTLPLFYISPHEAFARRQYTTLLALIFPLTGVVMLAWAMLARRRFREYGESRFAMNSVPGQIGGTLYGTIYIDQPLPAGQAVALELACLNRTTRGAIHNLTTWDWILWRIEQTSICDSAGSIPVAFLIAPDCRATDDSDPKSRIVWRLAAHASGPAGGYRAEFEVPVFKLGAACA
jgi:hypothetical protein